MPIVTIRGFTPRLGQRVWVAPNATLSGDLEAGDDVSFWFQSVARGDVHRIRIGARTNVQDAAILHVTHDKHPLEIGEGVVIGHAAVLHGCRVAAGALIGIGARVLDGATIEAGAQVAAGALVAPGAVVPGGHLALGIPARVVRPLSGAERDEIGAIAARYVALKEEYRSDG